MLHEIPIAKLGPNGRSMAEAVETCVHCGFCLPTCPTYARSGEEMNSPRGRIVLMKEVLEGGLTAQQAAPFVDDCLGCLSCETACPSGVKYGELLTSYRAWSESRRPRTWIERWLRWIVLATVPYPGRFRRAIWWGAKTRWLARLAPKSLQGLFDLLPAEPVPAAKPTPAIQPAIGTERARVVLMSGCAQQVLAPQIQAATIRVLNRNGVTVVSPQGQGCCGAIAAHTGDLGRAQTLARVNVSAWDAPCDAILSNAAGCGSGVHEYPLWFAGHPEQAAAERIASKTQDVSAFLEQLGLEPPPSRAPIRVHYQDACHLAHAQSIREAPRRLLQATPGVELVEARDAELCCGSAGAYNLEHPESARAFGEAKAARILETGCEVVATGNIGCLMQLRLHLSRLADSPPPVLHTMELLDQWYHSDAS